MSSYHKYLGKSNSPMPKAHLDILEKGDEIAEHVVLKRNDINQLFKNGYLTCENGKEPSQLFILLLSQGNPLTLVITLLKIVLIFF